MPANLCTLRTGIDKGLYAIMPGQTVNIYIYIYIYIIVPVLNSAMCDLKLHGEELSVCTPERSLYSF